MDFFGRQERARRTSRFLLVAFALAFAAVALAAALVSALVLGLLDGSSSFDGSSGFLDRLLEHPGRLGLIAGATLLSMGLASLYRAATLAGGGGQVARLLGGTEVPPDAADLPQRRLLNVVEEMAIASGLPVPEVYVLEHEAGINAFAAGSSPSDAAVAVTRGALERLDRDELQGVIAHELGHVLNGDIRLNQQLIGLSFGILVLSLIGRWLLRSARYARRGRRGGGAAAVVTLGAAFWLIGTVGLVLSRLIKAAVSRERERLADASAVQFTREPAGLASALKKIGGYTARLTSVDGEEVAHMLFERLSPAFRGLFATHPPLIERIRALDPTFDPATLAAAHHRRAGAASALAGEAAWASPVQERDATMRGPGGRAAMPSAGRDSAFAAEHRSAQAPSSPPGKGPATAEHFPSRDDAGVEQAWLERAGAIESPRLGAALHAALPSSIHDAAHSRDSSLLLVLALALSPHDPSRRQQLALLDAQLGSMRAGRCAALNAELARLDPALRIPVLELALPALRRRPVEQLVYLLELASRLVSLAAPRLFDYVLLRLLAAYLTGRPLAPSPPARLSVREACTALLAAVAAYGHQREADARDAFRAGLAAISRRPPRESALEPTSKARDLARLDGALARLSRAGPREKKAVLRAVLVTIRHDRRIGVEEAELFRAIAATLGCPLPPSPLGAPTPAAESRPTAVEASP